MARMALHQSGHCTFINIHQKCGLGAKATRQQRLILYPVSEIGFHGHRGELVGWGGRVLRAGGVEEGAGDPAVQWILQQVEVSEIHDGKFTLLPVGQQDENGTHGGRDDAASMIGLDIRDAVLNLVGVDFQNGFAYAVVGLKPQLAGADPGVIPLRGEQIDMVSL